MKLTIIPFLLVLVLIFTSCADKIDISGKLKQTQTSLVVDAFLANTPEKQSIRLSKNQFYFDNSGPIIVSGATVTVTDMNKQLSFVFAETKPGVYESSLNGEDFLIIGNKYQLSINYNGDSYSAYSKMNRVAKVDSITFKNEKKFNGDLDPEKFTAEFFATDIIGPGDRYWIRYFRNGIRDTLPSEIGVAYDAGIAGSIIDGLVFIEPLRTNFINSSKDNNWWKKGDEIKVELYSVTDEAAFFLSQVSKEASSGTASNVPAALFTALFSQPVANVPTNITNTSNTNIPALGFFSTSAVSSDTASVAPPYLR